MNDQPKTVADLAREALGRLTPLKDLLAQDPPWWQFEIQLRLRRALNEIISDPESAQQVVDDDAEREFREYLGKLSVPPDLAVQ